VPGIFAADEVSKICEDLRPVAVAAGLQDTKDNLFRLFVQRVRDNLHIILLMSPVGASLRVRCRQFPSLINCCTIDWFTPWPADALASVAVRMLGDEELGTKEEQQAICDMCVDIHSTVSVFCDKFFAELQRRVYTTPKSYLDLINLYLSMLTEKRTQLDDLRTTLAVVSRKLVETNAMVAGLKVDLAQQQPLIKQKTIEAGELLVRVAADKIEADKGHTIDTRTAAEKDSDAVKAWMRWRGFIGHLDAAESSALFQAYRDNGPAIWRDRKPTAHGRVTLAALVRLADIAAM
jgi:dynein heavy chain